jgi:hypothetical protein
VQIENFFTGQGPRNDRERQRGDYDDVR